MNVAKMVKVLATAGVAAVFAFTLAACSGNGASGGGVAATVNGTSISEDEVTNTIQNVRSQSGLDTEEAWGQFLASNDMTPESVREQIIDSLVSEELLKTGAAELGVTVEDSEVDSYVSSMRENFDSDEAWNEALTQAGFTEEEYRESIKGSLLQQGVSAHFEQNAETTDEELLEAAKMYGSYYDGAKRSSHILFDAGDEATAQDVLARIKAGSLDFAEAAKQYSKDSSAENGGDVGWDRTNSFVTAYQEALDALNVNEVSDLVTSDYGIHIIKCTDVYTAPEEITSIDQLPEEFRDMVKSQAASVSASQKSQEWLDGLREKAEIVINPMPSNVPYNIDVEKYKTASASAASAEATEVDSAGNATEAASGESATTETTTTEGSEGAASTDAAASGSSAAADDQAGDDEPSEPVPANAKTEVASD